MTRKLGIYVAPMLIAALLTPAGIAAAASRSGAPRACTNWVHTKSPNIGTGDNDLTGIAATSPSDAWAVGYAFFGVNTEPLAEHWNGKSWSVSKSPNVGTGGQFKAVYAVSPGDVWAVGSYFNGTSGRNLIEHWNGKSWSVVKSPDLGAGSNELTSVRGNSANDIWAAGDAVTSYPIAKTVILHWNGKRWREVSSPSVPAEPNFLSGVRPLSPAEAWAVGRQVTTNTNKTLILRWTKGHWRIVPSPNVGTGTNNLTGVRASSPTDAWAVGDYDKGTLGKTLILHWNGKQWRDVSSPDVGTVGNELTAIGGSSGSNLYAVGATSTGTGSTSQVLIVHWNGKHWGVVNGQNPGTVDSDLFAVYTQSPTNTWASGDFNSGHFDKTLIERCIG